MMRCICCDRTLFGRQTKYCSRQCKNNHNHRHDRIRCELGKKSIAEGVETREQAEFLIDNDCDFVQGYLYSYPLPQEEFWEFIAKQDFHTQRRKALEIV